MAVYKIFPTKDATIYSRYPTMNTGLDSILEANADFSTGVPHVSRYLVQFDQDEINSIINDKIGTSNYYDNSFSRQIDLVNYIANIQNLNVDTTLEAYAISGSWGMGTGHFNDSPSTTNGCNWEFRTFEGQDEWITLREEDVRLPLNLPFELGIEESKSIVLSDYVTASYGAVVGGGTWYTGSQLSLTIDPSQSYSYSSNKDLRMDVTNIIKNWYEYSSFGEGDVQLPQDLPFELGLEAFANDGFIVKQSENDEFVANINKQAKIQFYSVDTNTIYPPELQFKWDDFIHTTSSAISTINTTELVASLDNNPGTFRRNSVHKFRVNCRPQFPTRTYQTGSYFTQRNYLPTSSHYAVKDLDTNEFVINFDDTYTKISADTKSNYFTLYMNGLEPERYYKLLFKVVLDGETIVLDDNYYFKVING